MKQTLSFGQHSAVAWMHTATAALADALRRRAERQAIRRRAQSTEQALAALDARTLRDLGVTRSEIRSVANEMAGDIDPTQRRLAQLHR